MAGKRTYYNPVNGEYTTILESSAETGGEYTHFEVSLTPGGGNPIHYHTKFTEEFTAVKGRLGLYYKSGNVYLEPGESFLVPVGAHHRFFNEGDEDIVFRVLLRKGQPDFERFLKVMFGLVNDGKTITKNQVPKSPFHIAIMYVWGDTHLVNPVIKFLAPVITVIYNITKWFSIDKKLEKNTAVKGFFVYLSILSSTCHIAGN
jgi:mannose-6-phosphate isomerase-like protein (cupin superfamily)